MVHQLDNDGELHELVRAVGRSLDRPLLDFLSYKPALEDVMQFSAQAHSLSAEKRGRAVSWLKRHAAGLILVIAGAAMLAYSSWRFSADVSRRPDTTDVVRLQEFNDAQVSSAARFLVLKGRVTSGQSGVHGAAVMVSLEGEVQDPAACREPACTKRTTTTEGEFTIDLTKIQATNGDQVVLSVAKPGFAFFSKELVVDVRAMDAATAPQSVVLAALPPH